MEYLGREIAVLTGAVSRPVAEALSRRDDRGGDRAAGLFGGILDLFRARVLAALAPVAVLGAAVASSTSGFSVFLSAVNMLGGTLGAILLPGFLVLSALLYALSGYIADNLLPALKNWYQFVVDKAISGAQLIEAAFTYVARKVREFGDFLARTAPVVTKPMADVTAEVAARAARAVVTLGLGPTVAPLLGAASGGAGARPESEFDRILREIRERDARGGKPLPQFSALVGGVAAAGTGRPTFMERFLEGLRASFAEFKFRNQPPASYTTGAELYRQAQLAAVGRSPFEQRQAIFMDQVIKKMDEVIGGLPKPAVTD